MAKYDKKVWSWMLYDWAAQPYSTLLITFIFAPYFTSVVVGDPILGQSLWGMMTAVVGLSLAVLGPVLGAISDTSGLRKMWMAFFSFLYVLGAYSMWWAFPGAESFTVILVLFGIGMLGMELSQIFVNSMLSEICSEKDIGRVSGNGWSLGYVGGLLLLFITLLFFAENNVGLTLLGYPPVFGLDASVREGTRAVGPLTAIWYVLFMIPFFLFIPENKLKTSKNVTVSALRSLWKSIKKLPSNISLSSYLVSSMFYRDALVGIYSFGGIYASGVLGWSITQIGIFGIISGIAAAIFTFLGGFADKFFGPKRVIIFCIFVLILVCILIVGTSRNGFFGISLNEFSPFPDNLFLICGVAIGAAGGALQSASRTMLVLQADKDRMTEAFGLYALSGRATSWMAPALIGFVTYMSQNQQLGILPVVGLFILGLGPLIWVKPNL
ncbi:MFS transporter [Amylibacter sp.]|nr:MFS transporter [Amylibacter sp.]MDC1434559.1 MFS transporter [Amylibacter sp.]